MDQKIALHTIIVGNLQTNCYLIGSKNTKEAVLIDPGAQAEKIKAEIKKADFKLSGIILTHGHFDHIGALDDFELPVYIHREDVSMLEEGTNNFSPTLDKKKNFHTQMKTLENGSKITVGDLTFNVIHTPGHTPGGICLKVDNVFGFKRTSFFLANLTNSYNK